MGKHFFLNIYNVDALLLTEMEGFLAYIPHVLRENLAEILQESSHKFEPGGYTYLALLSTSHFSIHTWPENNCAAIDIFSCGDILSERIVNDVIQYFSPSSYRLEMVHR